MGDPESAVAIEDLVARFRRLDPTTWLTLDPALKAFVTLDADWSNQRPFSADEWVERVSEPTLGPEVPSELVELYEAARGAIAYGAFCYPLFALGCEQLWRVREAAAAIRCAQLEPPVQPKTYHKAIGHLRAAGLIPNDREEFRWHAARELRNLGSHPRAQLLVGPGDAMYDLRNTAVVISQLFSPPE